jgi:hypothetical protein
LLIAPRLGVLLSAKMGGNPSWGVHPIIGHNSFPYVVGVRKGKLSPSKSLLSIEIFYLSEA